MKEANNICFKDNTTKGVLMQYEDKMELDRVDNHTWSKDIQQEEGQKHSPLYLSLTSLAPALGYKFCMKCPHGNVANMKWQVLF